MTHQLVPQIDRARTLLTAVIEVLQGKRPAHQLEHKLVPSVYTALGRLRNTITPTPSRITVRLQRVSSTAVESCVCVHHKGSARPLALRLEFVDGDWVCSALEACRGTQLVRAQGTPTPGMSTMAVNHAYRDIA